MKCMGYARVRSMCVWCVWGGGEFGKESEVGFGRLDVWRKPWLVRGLDRG